MFNKKILILLFIVSLFNKGAAETLNTEITKYNIKVQLTDNDTILNIDLYLRLKKPDSMSELSFLFTSSADIDYIKIKKNHKWIDVSYDFSDIKNNTLCITLPKESTTLSKVDMKLRYKLNIGTIENMVLLDRGYRWYPLIVDQIAKVRLSAKLPQKYIMFCSGDLVSKKTSKNYNLFLWETKIPVFKIILLIGRKEFFKKEVIKIGSKNIYFYSSTFDKNTEKKFLSETENIFNFYNSCIGEYVHNNLTIVEIPELKGVDIGTGILLFGSTVISQINKGYYNSLIFALSTQWFGAGVFFKFLGKGFWFLQISLPHYLKLMYIKNSNGEKKFLENLEHNLDPYKEIANTEEDIPIFDINFPDTKAKSKILYGKGLYVLYKIHSIIGDKNWDSFIKDLYKNYKGRILTFDEFVEYLSKYDKSNSAVQYLNRWLGQTALPE